MKLNIENIEFRNFLSFGSKWQRLTLVPGVNLILGINANNQRSNGSGKSAILETIPFALFGQVNRDVKKDQIVNWKNRRECEVVISFSKGDDKYRILRAIKPDKLEVYKNNKPVDVPSHKRDFQRQIEDDILGIDCKTFMSIIHSNINSSTPILKMSKLDKRNFIERVFGLRIFTLMNSKSNENLSSIEKKRNNVSNDTNYNDRMIADLKEQNIVLFSKLSKIPNSTRELKDIIEEHDELIENSQFSDSKVKSLNDDLLSIIGLIDKNNRIVNKIDHRLDIMEEKSKNISKQTINQPQLQKKIIELGKIKNEISMIDVNILDYKLNVGKKDLDTNNDILNELKERQKKFEIEIAVLSNNIISSKKEELEGKEICPTCGTIIDSKKIIEEAKKEKENNRKDMLMKESELEVLNKDIKNLIKIIINIEANIKNIERIKSEYTLSLTKILPLDDINVEYEKNRKLINDGRKYFKVVSKLISKKEKIEIGIESFNTKRNLLNEEINDISTISAGIEKMKSEIDRLKERIQQENITRKEIESLIEDNNIKIRNGTNTINENTKKIKKINLLSDYVSYIKDICKDDNIKQFSISSEIPYLNQQSNYYLSESGHDFFIKLDKWLDCEIKGPGILNGSYGSLSGGESRSIDLALQFAFLDIARIKAGIWPDILITDELLDSSVDGYGLDKILGIIKVKQIENNLKMFLISHRKEVSEIDADNIYIVEKSGGYSNIVYN